MGNTFFVLVLVWPIPLPEGIDTGIGNTFWAQKYWIHFSNTFFQKFKHIESKFDKMCDELIGKRLLPMQKTFVKDYVEVMAPIACGLDVLQGEMVAGL